MSVSACSCFVTHVITRAIAIQGRTLPALIRHERCNVNLAITNATRGSATADGFDNMANAAASVAPMYAATRRDRGASGFVGATAVESSKIAASENSVA